jgi:predicted ribonuclease YlaK
MQYSKEIFEQYDKVYICGWVLRELEKQKHSQNEEKKYLSRQACRDIEVNKDKVFYFISENNYYLPDCFDKDILDNKIISNFKELHNKDSSIIALSNDILFGFTCGFINIPCEKFGNQDENDNSYLGYKEITLTEYELATFYECKINKWDLLLNEYLLLKDGNGDIVDKYRWTINGFVPIIAKPLKSLYLGDIKARDPYQMLAIDSLNNMDFTLFYGVAGSAKTLLSLGWIMQSIQTQKINKCVIVFNSVPLKNSQSQGFYPGDRNQKLLQSSLGGILSSKLGDMTMVETLITQGKLMLVPTCDIRGIEISENDCLYVSESQNIDAYTMRTILQRAKGKIIIEGDMLEQRDLRGSNSQDNGMLRAIEIFKGTKYFSCVKLKNTYRSPIAEIAQQI